MNGHTYYQPNETEQSLIAAGIIKPEHVDEDYQQYCLWARSQSDGVMDYSSWQAAKQSWDELNAVYEREIEPVYKSGGELTDTQSELENSLLRQMTQIETALGY